MDWNIAGVRGLENLDLSSKTPFIYVCNGKATELTQQTGRQFMDGYIFVNTTHQVLSEDRSLTFSILNAFVTFNVWKDSKLVKWCYRATDEAWSDSSPILSSEFDFPEDATGKRTARACTETLNLVICPASEMGKAEPVYMILTLSKKNAFIDAFMKSFNTFFRSTVDAERPQNLYELVWKFELKYETNQKNNKSWFEWHKATFVKKVTKPETFQKLENLYIASQHLAREVHVIKPQLSAGAHHNINSSATALATANEQVSERVFDAVIKYNDEQQAQLDANIRTLQIGNGTTSAGHSSIQQAQDRLLRKEPAHETINEVPQKASIPSLPTAQVVINQDTEF